MAKSQRPLPTSALARPRPFTLRFAARANTDVDRYGAPQASPGHVAACLAALEQFAQHGTWPAGVGVKALKHDWQGFYRLKVKGSFRVIFSVSSRARVVNVWRIGPRRDGKTSIYAR